MSHGRGRAPKIPAFTVRFTPDARTVRLMHAVPGSAEHYDVYRDIAAEQVRKLRKRGPVPGSGTTRKEWNDKCRALAQKIIDDEAKKFD